MEFSYDSTVNVVSLSMIGGESREIAGSHSEIDKVGVIWQQSASVQ